MPYFATYSTTPDWGASGRLDEYWADLIDPWTLGVVRSGFNFVPDDTSVTYGNYTDNLSEATIKMANDTYIIENQKCMVRLWHRTSLPTGESIEEILGTFFVANDPAEYKYKLETRSLQCYGPVYRLTQDSFADDYLRKMGETIEGGIRGGIDFCTFGHSSDLYKTTSSVDTYRVHTRDVWFQKGTNRAEAYRTICGWAGWELKQSDEGEIVIDKFVEPNQRPIKYTFEAGVNCTYEAGYTMSRDGDIYNRVVAWWSRDRIPTHARKNPDGSYAKNGNGDTIYDNDDDFGLSDRVVIDLPEGHINSAQMMGRLQTYTMQVTEPCSHDDLQLKATQFSNDHCDDVYFIEISHVGIPTLRAGDVVSYQNTTDKEEGVNYICEVTQISINSLSPGMMCHSKLKVLTEAPLPTDAFEQNVSWSKVGTTQIYRLMNYTHYQISKGAFV